MNCRNCGTYFERCDNHYQVHCNLRCAQRAANKAHRKRNLARKVERRCVRLGCRNQFVTKRNRIYCGKVCRDWCGHRFRNLIAAKSTKRAGVMAA